MNRILLFTTTQVPYGLVRPILQSLGSREVNRGFRRNIGHYAGRAFRGLALGVLRLAYRLRILLQFLDRAFLP